MTSAVIIDTETTDSDPKTCEVIEVAWESFDFGPRPVVSGRSLFGHSKPMAWGALATHHILPSEVQHLSLWHRTSLDLEPSQASYWIGHNIDFDWQVLGSPVPTRRICTLAMARAMWPSLDSHRLGALYYSLFGPSPETREKLRNAHSAAHDVQFCREILEVIIAEKGIADFETLYEFSEACRIPRTFTFGKFKGQPIENADRGYANWYRKQENPDPYLIEAFRRAGLL
jgi:exodeoxyribonuclease X